MMVAVELIGWIGAGLILTSYGLISVGKLDARSMTYQFMNILGAAGILVNSGWNRAIPSAALNLIWMSIGIVVVLRRQFAGVR
jgi:hypothetical protein